MSARSSRTRTSSWSQVRQMKVPARTGLRLHTIVNQVSECGSRRSLAHGPVSLMVSRSSVITS